MERVKVTVKTNADELEVLKDKFVATLEMLDKTLEEINSFELHVEAGIFKF